MSAEESLAQVYREIERPKVRNLKRAGLVIFVYSLLFTSLVSFFAVAIIPDDVRSRYFNNLISGIAMHLVGPEWPRLTVQIVVVLVGMLILAGAQTAMPLGSARIALGESNRILLRSRNDCYAKPGNGLTRTADERSFLYCLSSARPAERGGPTGGDASGGESATAVGHFRVRARQLTPSALNGSALLVQSRSALRLFLFRAARRRLLGGPAMSRRTLLIALRLAAILLVLVVVPLLWQLMRWLPWHVDCAIAAAAAFTFAYKFERQAEY